MLDDEASELHLSTFEKWNTLAGNLSLGRRLDPADEGAIVQEKQKWRDILHRLLDIILFLAHQNLAFRRHYEESSSLNRGNSLKLVELLSRYDPILKEHMHKIDIR